MWLHRNHFIIVRITYVAELDNHASAARFNNKLCAGSNLNLVGQQRCRDSSDEATAVAADVSGRMIYYIILVARAHYRRARFRAR